MVEVPGLNLTTSSPVFLESISAEPGVFFVHNLISDDEADSLVAQHAATLGPATVSKQAIGEPGDGLHPGRTGDNTWDDNSPVAARIISRGFKLLRIQQAPRMWDGLQIVRYAQKQFYHPHHDFFPPVNQAMDPQTGGANRFATLFFYLNDVELGGQTAFTATPALSDEALLNVSESIRPLLSGHKDVPYRAIKDVLSIGKPGVRSQLEEQTADVCFSSLAVKPKKLGAVLFYNLSPTWEFDQRTWHAGCPVLKGLKWGANMWFWNSLRTPAWDGEPDGNYGAKAASAIPDYEFYNLTPDVLFAYWFDTDSGNESFLGSIKPNEYLPQRTSMGHVFRFKQGNLVFVQTITASERTVVHIAPNMLLEHDNIPKHEL